MIRRLRKFLADKLIDAVCAIDPSAESGDQTAIVASAEPSPGNFTDLEKALDRMIETARTKADAATERQATTGNAGTAADPLPFLHRTAFETAELLRELADDVEHGATIGFAVTWYGAPNEVSARIATVADRGYRA